jgi:hypothetical protein
VNEAPLWEVAFQEVDGCWSQTNSLLPNVESMAKVTKPYNVYAVYQAGEGIGTCRSDESRASNQALGSRVWAEVEVEPSARSTGHPVQTDVLRTMISRNMFTTSTTCVERL